MELRQHPESMPPKDSCSSCNAPQRMPISVRAHHNTAATTKPTIMFQMQPETFLMTRKPTTATITTAR